jgi:hypothetical protein
MYDLTCGLLNSDLPDAESISKLKVAELKSLCTTYELVSTGLKPALVDRLLDFIKAKKASIQQQNEERQQRISQAAEAKKAKAEANKAAAEVRQAAIEAKRQAFILKKQEKETKKQAKKQAAAAAALMQTDEATKLQSPETAAPVSNASAMDIETKSPEVVSTPISIFFAANFPFIKYFDTASSGKPLFAGASWDEDMLTAETCFLALKEKFSELEECRPFELLRNGPFSRGVFVDMLFFY